MSVQIGRDGGFDVEEDQIFKALYYCCCEGNQMIVVQIADICFLRHWHYDADIRDLGPIARDRDCIKTFVNTSASCLAQSFDSTSGPEALRGLTLRSMNCTACVLLRENLFVLWS